MTPWTNRPDTVTVFSYRVFDPETCEMQVAPCKATREVIAGSALAEALEGTGEVVPRHALDAQGRYRRLATGWGAPG